MGAFVEKTKVGDHVEVGVHRKNREEITYSQGQEGQERQRRLKALPSIWYCLAGNSEEANQVWWIRELKVGDWLKVVYDEIPVFSLVFGQICSINDFPEGVTLDKNTILIDQQIKGEEIIQSGYLGLHCIHIIQVFTDNKETAELIQKNRKIKNGNG